MNWIGDPLSALALVVAAAWTAVVAAALTREIAVPLLALLAAPGAVLALLIWRREEAPAALRAAAGWTAILGGAVLAVYMLTREPLAVLVAPTLLASALATSRYPAVAVTATFVLTGTYGSVTAFTPVPVGEAIDVLLAGLWLGVLWGYLFGDDRRPLWIWAGVAAATAYIGITAFQIALADDTVGAFFSFRSSAWYMAAFLLIFLAPWPAETRMRIAKGIAVTALAVGAYAVFRYLVGPASTEQELSLARTGNPNFSDFVGSFTSSKDIARWCSQVIPFCLALALVLKGRWRAVAAAASALLAFALLAADTRLQLLAVCGGVAVVLGLHHFARGLTGLRLGVTATAAIVAALVGVAAFGLATGFSEESTDRYGALFEPREEKSFQARIQTWETVVDDIDERPWGRGLGTVGVVNRRFGRFASVSDQSLDNGYLKLALEQGIAVMVFFALAMVTLLYGLSRRAAHTGRPEAAALAIGAVGSLTSVLILATAGVPTDGFTALATWIIVGLGTAAFSRRERSRSPAREPAGPRATAVPA
ncbi:MAG: O-antigen ligase family protein [Pyrinomonadaceae bacterium]|nr:O-antigen ligase family protein [Pyrinomonadaceae bacterium]